ncbi:hypothetical protein [Shimazuella alba]|uniref:Uncharacterized protein n=1 Tax=Shimazuella alba TaxID=2690964 RepID=A0A6I4VSM2_9BACL|nr:hypothetical protein [Shimazuella alba]MXQ53458.1 hypothetical protein [Shimazuella alba]
MGKIRKTYALAFKKKAEGEPHTSIKLRAALGESFLLDGNNPTTVS